MLLGEMDVLNVASNFDPKVIFIKDFCMPPKWRTQVTISDDQQILQGHLENWKFGRNIAQDTVIAKESPKIGHFCSWQSKLGALCTLH